MGARVVPPQSERSARLDSRLSGTSTLLLDGATGSELELRGLDCGLPLWSTHALIDAPEQVFAIHRDHVAAGADLVTANTFRTQRRTLSRAAEDLDPVALTCRAVALARRAAQTVNREVFVLGSAPTLEDCYRPDLVPGAGELAREHAEHASILLQAGVDGIAVETLNTIREAQAACAAARATGLPFFASFVCGPDTKLLSGESLVDALHAVAPHGPRAILVNCLPPESVPACLAVLRARVGCFGAYANLCEPAGSESWTAWTPRRYATHVRGWLGSGARIVGGCCGASPEHIAALRAELDRRRD